MSEADLKYYMESRPYIRASLALAFYLRWHNPLMILPKPWPIGAYFTMADEFLTEFEMRRSA